MAITTDKEGQYDWIALLLQTSDPLFPTGAYAHSLGLEQSVQLDVVRDEEWLLRFLREQIIPALENLELPWLRWARAAARAQDVAELCALNSEIDAWKICRELREASAQIGTRRMQMLLQISSDALLAAFAGKKSRAHHLVVCGIQWVDVPLEAALTAYVYQTLAGYCSAALKLIRIGQEGCQRVLQRGLADAPTIVARSLKVEREKAGWFNPVIEIASMQHEKAWERLFIS